MLFIQTYKKACIYTLLLMMTFVDNNSADTFTFSMDFRAMGREILTAIKRESFKDREVTSLLL